jgi:hypothetical protein
MYTKLYSTILDSSIWSSSDSTRLVWITMLAMATKNGIVHASVDGLARRANVPLESAQAALVELSSPDPNDKSGVREGRRIVPMQGCWQLVNFEFYRETRSIDAVRKEQWRSRKSAENVQDKCLTKSNVQDNVPRSAPAPAPAPAQMREKRARKPPAGSIIGGGVARTYSLPSQEAPDDYLQEALMAGVPRVQAESTWTHYFGAGLPERGVERLNQWLVKRSKERQAATTKAERGGRKGDSVQPSLGKTGWETLEGKKL